MKWILSSDDITKVSMKTEPVFTVGTLVYNRAGLVMLFGWLLWGDFVFTMMANTMPSILPLLLKEHGATNLQIAFITSTLGMLLNMVMNPIISYRSDRYRSRWGRRRPFIIWTTPFVVFFLMAVPFSPEISAYMLHSSILSALLRYSPISPLILVFGILTVGFQVFNLFVSSVYYYLIPDVVPQPLLGRFYGLFRIFGAAAGLVFNYFLYGIAEQHMKELFAGIAVFYGVMIILVCLRVKEGEYPQPKQNIGSNRLNGVYTYARECFGSVYFWWVFLAYSCTVWASLANSFIVFFYRDEIGFTLNSYGKLLAVGNVLISVIVYPVGMLLDKWGSHKSLIAGQIIGTAVCILAFLTICGKWSAGLWMIAFWLSMTLPGMAIMKWTVDVFPRDRYGQFGSAGAMFSSCGAVLLSLLCGKIMDRFGIYRFFWLWIAFFTLLGAIAAFVVYRKQTTNALVNNIQLETISSLENQR
jgi:MFS family permease